jgi:hypothetical protein
VRKGNWVIPRGPVARDFHIDSRQAKKLLRELGGMWVQWTGGFNNVKENSEWYAVICRQHTDIDSITSTNTRSKLRRGLKNCSVQKVSSSVIAEDGYDTYCAALKSYRGWRGAIPTRAEFKANVLKDVMFDDIRHQWAVYHEGSIVGFAQNLIYDDVEADYTLIKLHPDYLRYYPAYALFHKMNEYYLRECKFQYVNDGFRSISHDTGIQDFLITKFGFEKAYTNLNIFYRRPFGEILSLTRPFRHLFTRFNPNFDALYELDRLRQR